MVVKAFEALQAIARRHVKFLPTASDQLRAGTQTRGLVPGAHQLPRITSRPPATSALRSCIGFSALVCHAQVSHILAITGPFLTGPTWGNLQRVSTACKVFTFFFRHPAVINTHSVYTRRELCFESLERKNDGRPRPRREPSVLSQSPYEFIKGSIGGLWVTSGLVLGERAREIVLEEEYHNLVAIIPRGNPPL
jgi:hypothetical protein